MSDDPEANPFADGTAVIVCYGRRGTGTAAAELAAAAKHFFPVVHCSKGLSCRSELRRRRAFLPTEA
jgi:hypothetical protein